MSRRRGWLIVGAVWSIWPVAAAAQMAPAPAAACPPPEAGASVIEQGGVTASWAMNRSCSREGPDRPASKAASSTLAPASRLRRASAWAMAPTKVLGLTPAQRVKMRWKWNGDRPTASAASSSEGWSCQWSASQPSARSMR